jgi:hypothetical protein
MRYGRVMEGQRRRQEGSVQKADMLLWARWGASARATGWMGQVMVVDDMLLQLNSCCQGILLIINSFPIS